MDDMGSMRKSMTIMLILMIVSLIIASLWHSIPLIKNSVHSILDPTAGALLNWNLTIGMLVVIFILSVFTTLAQKYTTDQKTLKELKEAQKEAQKKMREVKNDPQKVMEMQKETLPLTFRIMELSFRSAMFTVIPLILLFRWFVDYFLDAGNPKFFGFMTWFWFYLIFAIVFSSILRKIFKVA